MKYLFLLLIILCNNVFAKQIIIELNEAKTEYRISINTDTDLTIDEAAFFIPSSNIAPLGVKIIVRDEKDKILTGEYGYSSFHKISTLIMPKKLHSISKGDKYYSNWFKIEEILWGLDQIGIIKNIKCTYKLFFYVDVYIDGKKTRLVGESDWFLIHDIK